LSLRVLVRRAVGLAGRSSSTVGTTRPGGPVKLSAQVGPATAGLGVSFRLYRYDSARRAYVYAGSRGARTDGTGRASITWAPSVGKWAWRVSIGPTPGFANNLSPLYRWTVAR
jgi:hypothetical protein